MEMNDFVDSFQSEHVKIHFDTGNISIFQYPEHWVPIMGKRIKNIHFKEFTKKGTDYSLETFRPLLDGTTNWPAVMEELDKVGYRGYVTLVFSSLSTLPGGLDLPDVGLSGPHPGADFIAGTRSVRTVDAWVHNPLLVPYGARSRNGDNSRPAFKKCHCVLIR